jgi:D-alanyl-lipoteichoic acid acyltransferase DltB (MBOAT superfamily)
MILTENFLTVNLLNKNVRESVTNSAVSRGVNNFMFGIVVFVVGLVVAVVLIYSVAIPTIKTSAASANLTSNELSVSNAVPIMVLVVLLALAAGGIYFAFKGQSG